MNHFFPTRRSSDLSVTSAGRSDLKLSGVTGQPLLAVDVDAADGPVPRLVDVARNGRVLEIFAGRVGVGLAGREGAGSGHVGCADSRGAEVRHGDRKSTRLNSSH